MDRRQFLVAAGIGTVQVCVMSSGLKGLQAQSGPPVPEVPAVWFKRFHGHRTDTLLQRRKTRLFVESAFAGVTLPFWNSQPVWAVLRKFMSKPDSVAVEHHRYVVATGCMAHFGPCRAMMWLDAKSHASEPTVIFSFVNIKGPERELWITSNRNLGELPPSELPHHFTLTMNRWLRSRRPHKWEGGLLNRLVIYDHSSQKNIPVARAWGVKPYRCARNVAVQAL